MSDRLLGYTDPTDPRYNSPFAAFVSVEDWQRTGLTLKSWHGQERSGRVTIADLSKGLGHTELDDEDDFLLVLARRPMSDKAVDKLLKKDGKPVDPRVVVWAPADMSDNEKATLAGVGAHLLVADENRDNTFGKEGAREFRRDAHRVYNVLVAAYSRGVSKTSRITVPISAVRQNPEQRVFWRSLLAAVSSNQLTVNSNQLAVNSEQLDGRRKAARRGVGEFHFEGSEGGPHPRDRRTVASFPGRNDR